MLKTISTTFAWAGAWAATTATAWAGNVVTPPPPAVNNDSGNDGLLLLALVGVVVFAVAKGVAKPVDQGGPDIVSDDAAGGNGKL